MPQVFVSTRSAGGEVGRWTRIVSLRRSWLALIITLLAVAPASAQKSGGLADDLTSDILSDLKGKTATDDLAGLRDSHLSLIETWDGVEPFDARKKMPGKTYAWKAGRGFVSPRRIGSDRDAGGSA